MKLVLVRESFRVFHYFRGSDMNKGRGQKHASSCDFYLASATSGAIINNGFASSMNDTFMLPVEVIIYFGPPFPTGRVL